MTNNARVSNITRGYSLKHKQAVRAVDNCAAAWVVYGESIRDLTLAEAIAARNKQASEREPLAQAEIPGLVYEPNAAAQSGYRRECELSRAANKFFEEQTA